MAVLFFKQSHFIKNIGLKHSVIVALFLLKILGGLFYHYMMTVRFYGGDSHLYFLDAIGHIQNLSTDWRWELNYFLFGWTPIKLGEHYYSTHNTVAWSDLGSQLNYRIMYISSLLSFGHETVNIIFYNFLFFIGQLALYKAFIKMAPTKKWFLLCIVFAIPSVWFWCSGIHKDGFVLSLLGMLLLAMYNYTQQATTKYFIIMALALIGLFCIRYYICLLILPIWITFLFANKVVAIKKWQTYLLGFITFILLFFNAHYLINAIQPAKMVVVKQAQFLALKGNSFIAMDTLQPTARSFIKAAPKAIGRVMARPYLQEAKDVMYGITAIETTLLLILMLYLSFVKKQGSGNGVLIYFCILLALSMFLIIGFIVPFSGAFIRYRAAYYPVIIGALYCMAKLPFLEKIERKMQNYILA